jgi:hypothetical protein
VIDAAMEELARRATTSPDDGPAAFEYASALDNAGRETEAVAVYRRALACQLPEEMGYRVRVQLGSSLRALGKIEESAAVHLETSERWPDR